MQREFMLRRSGSSNGENQERKSNFIWWRQLGVFFVYICMILNSLFTILLVGMLFSTFSIFIRTYFAIGDWSQINAASVFEFWYLALLFVFILISNTKPLENSQIPYTIIVILFSVSDTELNLGINNKS